MSTETNLCQHELCCANGHNCDDTGICHNDHEYDHEDFLT